MRTLTPLQFLVACAAHGRDQMRNNAVPIPPGFDQLFDGLRVAAMADTTTVTTQLQSDTTEGESDPMELLTLDKAAGITGKSRRTIERRIKSGALPAHKDGRRVYVTRCDLETL